jgi:hemoglobin
MRGRPPPERHIQIDDRPLATVLDEAMIRSVVHTFYDRVRHDELLGPIFKAAIPPSSWSAHLSKLCDFWSSIFLRSGRYHGQPLPPHLAIAGLSDGHFERWLSLFQITVRSECPAEVASLFMDRALRIANSFRMAIAFSRGESTLSVRPIGEGQL